MPTEQSKKTTLKRAALPAMFALGAVTTFSFRGNATSPSTPVVPPSQALDMQSAFEQVADKMRPSVVYIESLVKTRTVAQAPQGDGGDGNPFGFTFPGTPGGPGGSPNLRQFRAPQQPRGNASGSGVIVRSDGYIITNDHVVEGADKVRVKLQDGRIFYGKVLRDFKSDLAVVKIDADNLPAAELADSDKVRIGQWAMAFGSPFGLSDTVTQGIVSSLHRSQTIGARTADARFYSSLIQTDASINPGNSGGPLVDLYGRVVGINVAIESPSGGSVGIGFAIPANTARYVMDQLVTKGKVTRGYLGLTPQALTVSEQAAYKVSKGALIVTVAKNSPADKAGLQIEDVVTAVNGKPVEGELDFREAIARTKPGSTVSLDVQRDGQPTTVKATVGTPPDETAQKPDAKNAPDSSQGRLGVTLGDLKEEEVSQFKIDSSVKRGAVVVEVLPGSPAADAGLQPGDVILRVAGKTINSAADVKPALANVKGGTINLVISRTIGGQAQSVLVPIELD